MSDPSIKSRIIGVQETFQYFYGVFLGELLLKHSDNLSKTLQSYLPLKDNILLK